MPLHVKNNRELDPWLNKASAKDLPVTKQRKPKVKRSPELYYTDEQRALTLATTPLAKAVIGRALARMEAERQTAPVCADTRQT